MRPVWQVSFVDSSREQKPRRRAIGFIRPRQLPLFGQALPPITGGITLKQSLTQGRRGRGKDSCSMIGLGNLRASARDHRVCGPIIGVVAESVAMKLVLLGTGGYFPTARRHTACLMFPEIGVVLDAGTGICRIGKHLQTDRLEIFLTHAHLDHVAGLTYLINVVPQRVLAATTVYGSDDVLTAVREHLFADAIFPVPPTFKFQSLHGPCTLPQGGMLTPFPLAHPGGSLGFRLDWPGRSMAYVTDTTAKIDAPYIDAIRGVDVLVHEAYFADDTENLPAITGHSALAAVAELAATAKPGRLVLVHIDPLLESDHAFDLESARRTFPNIVVGQDGDEFVD
jgi:ribonuclease Z